MSGKPVYVRTHDERSELGLVTVPKKYRIVNQETGNPIAAGQLNIQVTTGKRPITIRMSGIRMATLKGERVVTGTPRKVGNVFTTAELRGLLKQVANTFPEADELRANEIDINSDWGRRQKQRLERWTSKEACKE